MSYANVKEISTSKRITWASKRLVTADLGFVSYLWKLNPRSHVTKPLPEAHVKNPFGSGWHMNGQSGPWHMRFSFPSLSFSLHFLWLGKKRKEKERLCQGRPAHSHAIIFGAGPWWPFISQPAHAHIFPLLIPAFISYGTKERAGIRSGGKTMGGQVELEPNDSFNPSDSSRWTVCP